MKSRFNITILFTLLLLMSLVFIMEAQTEVGPGVHVIEVEGIINPVSAKYIVNAIDQAQEENASCLILVLDTPGGLMESMRMIVSTIV